MAPLDASRYRYCIALGSNRASRRLIRPHDVLERAFQALTTGAEISLVARSRIVTSRAMGFGRRDYANAAAIIATPLSPPQVLSAFKAIERAFGRRPGRRWGDRPLDLDIILWSGGRWRSAGLSVPHIAWHGRSFVLHPLLEVASDWREPMSMLTVRHRHARSRRAKPVDRHVR